MEEFCNEEMLAQTADVNILDQFLIIDETNIKNSTQEASLCLAETLKDKLVLA